jgi:hypothetical protein
MVRPSSLIFILCLASNPGADAAEAPANVPSLEGSTPGHSDTAGDDPRTEGVPNCRFERPKAWPAGGVTWLGSCHKGFADGNGILVNVVEGQEPERFYGRVQQGRLRVGVLQTSDGYVAGSWAHGAIAQPSEDDIAQRNLIITAFRAAANASTAVSKSFERKGDSKSSRFYAKQARLLREQMD